MQSSTTRHDQDRQTSRLGPWVLCSTLGRHPGALLYSAKHHSNGRLVLLQVLAPELSADPGARAHFLRQAHIAGQGSPRMLRAIEVSEYDGYLVSVMEFPHGQVASAFPLPLLPETAVSICLDVAQALAVMHRCNVANGALRTSAILITDPDNRTRPGAKLLDSGLCLPFGKSITSDTRDSPHSLPPENAWGQPLSPQTDVYGLAALAFELMTGRAYQPGARLMSSETIPSRLPLILGRCLSFDPADRPATILEIAGELEWIRDEICNRRFDDALFSIDEQPDLIEADPFGEHDGWFIEDGAVLTEHQQISLYGYLPERRGRFARMALVATAFSLLVGAALGITSVF